MSGIQKEPSAAAGSAGGAEWCEEAPCGLKDYLSGFEENDALRSAFIRQLTVQQLRLGQGATRYGSADVRTLIPKTLVRFWHDPDDLPSDVGECLATWDVLRHHGFVFRMFDDASAAAYIAQRFGRRERVAFARCRHPAMRSDYLRMCVVLAEGGLYVDADDVLLDDGWKRVFRDGRLKVQPLCYDLTVGAMVAGTELGHPDLSTDGRIFYVNNNPIAAPAGHPVLRRALARATDSLLRGGPTLEIQSTTGPGNLTAALAAHARESHVGATPPDFELLLDWETTAEPCWELAYRSDGRNWRNMNRY